MVKSTVPPKFYRYRYRILRSSINNITAVHFCGVFGSPLCVCVCVCFRISKNIKTENMKKHNDSLCCVCVCVCGVWGGILFEIRKLFSRCIFYRDPSVCVWSVGRDTFRNSKTHGAFFIGIQKHRTQKFQKYL